jgi:hypothetical protein
MLARSDLRMNSHSSLYQQCWDGVVAARSLELLSLHHRNTEQDTAQRMKVGASATTKCWLV